MEITVSQVQSKLELEDVARLLEAIFSESSDEVYDLDKLYERSVASKDFKVFRILEKSELVGFALGYEREEGYYHIWILAVDKNQRGKGLATTLYQELEDYAKSTGYKGMTINSFNRYSDNLRLIIGRGYQIYDLDKTDKFADDPKLKFRLRF